MKKLQSAISRATVRRALGSPPWVEPLLLAFAPVFTLLSLVAPEADVRLRCIWGVFGAGCLVVAIFSFIEQRRRTTLVLELYEARREVAMGRFMREELALSRDTPLRCYPIQASFFLIEVRTATCPSSRPRPGARALAICVSLLLGWWSPIGLLRTPLFLWRCLRGGELTTPGELIDKVSAYVESDRDAQAWTGIKVLLLAILAVAVLFGLALLIARLTI